MSKSKTKIGIVACASMSHQIKDCVASMKGNFEIYPLVPPCTFNLKVDLIRYYLDKSISKNNITIIVFGICHPQMLKALAKYGDKVVRVKASNCYEMYLGKEKYEEFHRKSYFMLTKQFFTDYKKDLLAGYELNTINGKILMKGLFKKLLYLEFKNELIDISLVEDFARNMYLDYEVKYQCFLFKRETKNFNGPFLKEEMGLINTIADNLSRYIEKTKAENEIQAAHSELDQILNSTLPTYVMDTEYNVIKVNDTYSSLFQIKKEEMIGKKCYDIWQGPLCHTSNCSLKQILGGKEIFEYEVEKKLKDGTRIDCIVNCYPYRMKDGKIIGLIKNFVDITERKKMQSLLQESEKKYRILFEDAADSIVIIDPENGDIVDFNKMAYKNLGYTFEEFKDIKLSDFEIVESSLEVKAHIQKIYNNGADNFETQHITKEGEIRNVHVNTKVINFQKKPYILSIFRDITELKKAEEIISKEVERLREIDEIKNEFIIRASHELKTPLIPIYSLTELILNDYKDKLDPKLLEYINLMHLGGLRLYDLIADLIEISKINLKEVKLKFEKVNLVKLVQECRKNFSVFALEKDIDLNIFVGDEDIHVYVDRNKIKQAINEIILNAIKYTPTGGKISINLHKFITCVNIIIKDTGVGFTEDEKTKIFKKFGKIERYGQGMDIITEGFGLGLYISKKNIELHGGKITLTSEGRDKGTIMKISIPMNSHSPENF